MNFPNTWNRTTTPDQLVANQDVHDDDLYRTFSNPPGSLFCATDMRSMAAADHQISSTNHPTPPTVGSWTSGNSSSSTDHNHGNFTEGRYSTQSISASTYQTLDMPPSQSAYPYSITANVLSSVPDYDPWHNPPTLHSTQHYNPELRSASIRHSYSPVLRSDDSSPSTSQKVYPNDHPSRSTTSSQHTANYDTPFVFDPTIPSRQWQNPTVPRPGPPSLPFMPMIPPPLAAESSRFRFVTQPRATPPINHSDSFPRHSHPSSPLLSCRWLDDGTVTPCGFTGTLDVLKAHCTTSHFTGSRFVQIECQWEGCSYYKRFDPTIRVMRRDCIWRHTCEVHLGLKRGT